MPEQETFWDGIDHGQQIRIIKTYDGRFAKDAFEQLDEEALRFLSTRLGLEEKYEPAEIPSPTYEDFAEFLWMELEDGARESNLFSYFVVTCGLSGHPEPRFVSADWPASKAFVEVVLRHGQSPLNACDL